MVEEQALPRADSRGDGNDSIWYFLIIVIMVVLVITVVVSIRITES